MLQIIKLQKVSKNRKVKDSFWDLKKKENVNISPFSIVDDNVFGQRRFIILEVRLKKEKELRFSLITERLTKKIDEVSSTLGNLHRNYSHSFMIVSGEVANMPSTIDEQDENFNVENDI